ncbi:MAG: ORF6N domain-containing protein [Bacteroidetes bacterium]|nr:ORF6N domain-containing protein [Bacteroidota bacterium]
MTKENNLIQILPEERILDKIYLIRSKKIMIDRDLAELYGVETRVLNQTVKRNIKRFPDDFMFQLTQDEFNDWKSQIVISNNEKMGLRKPPLVFTEQGVAMLSSVLNSERAIMVNIQIIRVFTKMREMLSTQQEILKKFEQIDSKLSFHDDQFMLIFEYLKQFEEAKQLQLEQANRKKIGYRKPGE